MFVMYSGENWMKSYIQWVNWELVNCLFDEPDSAENIIYDEASDEELPIEHYFVLPIPPQNPPSPESEGSNPTSIRGLGTSSPNVTPPRQSASAPIPSPLSNSLGNLLSADSLRDSIVHPESVGERIIHPPLQQPERHVVWKPARRRNPSELRAGSVISLGISGGASREPERDRVKLNQFRARQLSTALMCEFCSNPEQDQSTLLPELGLLLPPCLRAGDHTIEVLGLPPFNSQQTVAPPAQPPGKVSIKSATLIKLVEHLTTPYGHDLQYMKTFLLTYIYFTSPQTLFKLLIRRYFIFPGESMVLTPDWEERIKTPIRLRVFNILKVWLENYDMDFGQHLLSSLKEFSKKHLAPIMSQQILKLIRHKRLGYFDKPKTVSDFQFNAAPPYPDVPKNIFSQTLGIWEVSDLEIARQLTIIEFNLFSAIRPRELLNQAWKVPKFRQGTRSTSPNIMEMLRRFNDIRTKWVPTMIERAPLLKQKVKVLKRFILIAGELLKLNNFHDATAILQGIKLECEIRFHGIWADLPNRFKREFRVMEGIVSSEEQYKAALPNRHSVLHSCIPILDYHLKKLVAVETLVPSVTGNMVNFAKCRYVYRVVSELVQFQQTPYNLQPVTQIADLIRDFRDLDNLDDEFPEEENNENNQNPQT